MNIFSWIFSIFRFPGSYRVACLLYPYRKTPFQKGVFIQKRYLSDCHKLSIKLFSKDLIDHKILFTGAYEPSTNMVLEKYLQKGFNVLEAGANSGTETLLISRLVGATGHVYAIEPVPHIVEKLKGNLELNSISNVVVMPFALGEARKEIAFSVYPSDHPNQGMGSKVFEYAGLERISVWQDTIDSLMDAGTLNRLDFVKMDVQGGELDILKGAGKTIARFRPKIFLEADNLSDLGAIYDYLSSFDYKVFYILANSNLEIVARVKPKIGNWLAIPMES